MTNATAESVTTMNISAAENAALDIAMGLDQKVLLLGEDIADPAGGVFKVTKGLSTKYGAARVRATPIAEQSIVGAAVGAALAGYRPVPEIMFFDFAALAMDQIVNHAAKFRYMSGGRTSCPITVRTAVGSNRFGSQHSQSLEAWFMHTPGLRVVMPASPADAKGLLLSCIFSDDPCLYIEHTSMLFTQRGPVPDGDVRVPLGQASILRAGEDVTLITYGMQVPAALEAAADLAAAGISAEVIDLRSLVPLDLETILASVAKTRRAVVAHSAITFCGPAAEVACLITEELFGDLLAPVVRLGSDFAPRAFAPTLSSEPTAESITASITRLAKAS
jgi:pyruvate dehydrogenase E1 component beta subunit/2-oxoisovalerate dehydrogenase E1 component